MLRLSRIACRTVRLLDASVGAFACIAILDIVLACGGFPLLYRWVKSWPLASDHPLGASVDDLVRSVERAALFYIKDVKCLQFAAAAVCLLRSKNVPASLVLGVHQQPFYAHAWVESDSGVLTGTVNKGQYLVVDQI